MAEVEESIEIKATPKQCYDVITDYETYPEFVAGTSEVEIEKKSGQKARVTYSLDMIKKISYTLDHTGKAGKSLKWTLVKGDFMKKNEGEWTLEEVKKGVTLATYSINIQLGMFVPGSIEKKLISHHLPEMMKAFKKRIEKLAKKK